jgi:hypothetical protein
VVVGHDDGEVMWGIRVKKQTRALFRPSSANAPKTVLAFRVLCAREKEYHEPRRRAGSATRQEGKGFAVKETRPNIENVCFY